MPIITLNLNPEPHWPDLAERPESVIHLGNGAPAIQVASLPGGMDSGRTSVALRLDLPDGRTVVAETSLRLLLTVARALASRYPDEAKGIL